MVFRLKSSHLNVKETRPGDVRDRRSDLLTSMNYIYTESVHSVTPNIVSVDPRDENFSFMIIHKKSPNHLEIFLNFRNATGFK